MTSTVSRPGATARGRWAAPAPALALHYTSPPAGQRLKAAPGSITLNFSEAVTINADSVHGT